MNMSRLLLLVAIPMAMLTASMSVSATCTSGAKNYISAGYQAQNTLDQAGINNIASQMAAHPPPGIMDSNGINTCVSQNWPSMFPGAATILSGVGSQIVSQICNAARQKIASSMPSYLNSVYSSVSHSQIPSTLGTSIGGVSLPTSGLPSIPTIIQPTTPTYSAPTTTTSPLGGLFGGGTNTP